jgi:predicted esterase
MSFSGKKLQKCDNSGLSYLVDMPRGDVATDAPVVVLLHGRAQNAQLMMRASLPAIRAENPQAIIYAVQAPHDTPLGEENDLTQKIMRRRQHGLDSRTTCHDWFSTSQKAGGYEAYLKYREQFCATVAQVGRFLDRALTRHGVDESALTVIGFSQGGIVGLDAVLARARPATMMGFCSLYLGPVMGLQPQCHPRIFWGQMQGDEVLDSALNNRSLRGLRELDEQGSPVTLYLDPGQKVITRKRLANGGITVEMTLQAQSKMQVERRHIVDDFGRKHRQVSISPTAHYVSEHMLRAALLYQRGLIAPEFGLNPIRRVSPPQTALYRAWTRLAQPAHQVAAPTTAWHKLHNLVARADFGMTLLHVGLHYAHPKTILGRMRSAVQSCRKVVQLHIGVPLDRLFNGLSLPVVELDLQALSSQQAKNQAVSAPAVTPVAAKGLDF